VKRALDTCENTRYPNINSICLGDVVSDPFGTDPTFKPATASYNPELTEIDMLRAYNCSQVYGSDAVRLCLFAIPC
jgi:hypothetical protein